MIELGLIYFYAFIILMIPKQSREAAFVFVMAHSFYQVFVWHLDGNWYYASCAGLNFIIGMLLYKNYKLIGSLAFLLIGVNYLGWIMCEHYFEPAFYNYVCSVIILIQIMALIDKAAKNGIGLFINSVSMVCRSNFAGHKVYGKMHKKQTTKKTQCTKR